MTKHDRPAIEVHDVFPHNDAAGDPDAIRVELRRRAR